VTVRAVPGGVLVEVRVRPRSRPRWQITAGALMIRVAGAPVDGAATEEPRRALAKALGVAPSRVSLHRGERSRTKVFAAAGVDEEAAGGAQEGRGGSPGSWWSWSSCLKSSSSIRRNPRPTSVRQLRRIAFCLPVLWTLHKAYDRVGKARRSPAEPGLRAVPDRGGEAGTFRNAAFAEATGESMPLYGWGPRRNAAGPSETSWLQHALQRVLHGASTSVRVAMKSLLPSVCRASMATAEHRDGGQWSRVPRPSRAASPAEEFRLSGSVVDGGDADTHRKSRTRKTRRGGRRIAGTSPSPSSAASSRGSA
jgi:uncharacterized protein